MRPEMSDVACAQGLLRVPPPTAIDRGGIGAGFDVGLDDVVGPVGDALEQRAVDVAAGVGEVEAEEHALGMRIVDRRPFAGEVGQEDQAVGARRRVLGLGRERDHGRGRIEVAGERVAEPVGEGAAGGEARHRGVLAGKQPRRVPQPLVADAVGR